MGYRERRKNVSCYFAHFSEVTQEEKDRLHSLVINFMLSVASGMVVGIGMLWPILRSSPYQSASPGIRKLIRFLTVCGPTTYTYVTSKTTTIDPFFQEMYEKYCEEKPGNHR